MNQLLQLILLDKIRFPHQPREHDDEAASIALAENLKSIGQQTPVILYPFEDGFAPADGFRRCRALIRAGSLDVLAMVLDKKPDESKLLLVQISLDAHHQQWKPFERAKSFAKILDLNGWTATQLSQKAGISP